jgi:enoyl-CoA hydratase/carnithine racemase
MDSADFHWSLETHGNGVALLSFADPGRQNQLCWAAVERLADLLDDCVKNDVRVVVIASALPGHWLEHAWLSDLDAGLDGQPTTGDGIGWFRAINALCKPPLITIAAITGNTCGGGCELGWACDLRVAEPQAQFAQPEIRLGITPGLGGVSRLNSLLGRTLAAEMVLAGEWVDAQRIHDAGGINRLVDSGRAVTEALAWANELAAMPATALAYCKQVLAECQELPLGDALLREQEVFQLSTVNARQLMREQQAYYDAGGTTRDAFKRGATG